MAGLIQIVLAQESDAYEFSGHMGQVFVGIMLLVGIIMLVQRIKGKRSKR